MSTFEVRELEPFEVEALKSYATEHGRHWKTKLQLDWYNARAIGERGSILHALRNDPRWSFHGLELYRVTKR